MHVLDDKPIFLVGFVSIERRVEIRRQRVAVMDQIFDVFREIFFLGTVIHQRPILLEHRVHRPIAHDVAANPLLDHLDIFAELF